MKHFEMEGILFTIMLGGIRKPMSMTVRSLNSMKSRDIELFHNSLTSVQEEKGEGCGYGERGCCLMQHY